MKPTDSIFLANLSSVLLIRIILVLSCIIVIATCSYLYKHHSISTIPEGHGSKGYLSMESLPNGLAILLPSPVKDSAAFAFDEEVSRNSLTLRGTPRWELAREDSNFSFTKPASAFTCALNVQISQQDTPHIYTLLRRTFDDARFSYSPAKIHYQRPRPFVLNNEPICLDKAPSKYRSYPSGHATIGWTWALILSEIAPEQSDAILARARAFGQSRVICNVHWQSDVNAGLLLGTAVVARLHAEPEFMATIEAAKAEFEVARSKGLSPERDCEAEAAALSFSQGSTP